MSGKDLAVIVVSFNTKETTHKSLLLLHTAKCFCERRLGNKVEVIVVDNGSSDGSLQMIREKHPWVKLIDLGKNLGFGRANNLAMRRTKTSYILLLNSDVFLKKDTILKSLDLLDSQKDYDALSIKLIFPDGRFQPSGGFLPTPFRSILWLLGFESIPLLNRIIPRIYMHDESFFAKQRCLEWATSSFFLLKRRVYEKTKGFDRKLFLYFEDVEWCKRVKQKGLKILYTPEVVATHIGGESGKGISPDELLRYQIQGFIYFHKKFYPKALPILEKFISIHLFSRLVAFSILRDKKKAVAYKNLLKKYFGGELH